MFSRCFLRLFPLIPLPHRDRFRCSPLGAAVPTAGGLGNGGVAGGVDRQGRDSGAGGGVVGWVGSGWGGVGWLNVVLSMFL